MNPLETLSEQAQATIQATENYVSVELADEASGHDWWHIYRVTQSAIEIAQAEEADLYICTMAALLHDIADEKLNSSEAAGLKKVVTWLDKRAVSEEAQAAILEIITTMSFKGGNNKKVTSLEGQVVQDADRLDAIGAIGIARAMTYSGFKGRPIHDPNLKPRENLSVAEYRNGKDSAIMHFYEKLLKLKDLMNTAYGRQLAEGRHQFMEVYLEEFYQEWAGKK